MNYELLCKTDIFNTQLLDKKFMDQASNIFPVIHTQYLNP